MCPPCFDIREPVTPARVSEAPCAVSASKEIELQHGPARPRECARSERRHSAALVHLLREWVHIQYRPAARSLVMRLIQHAEALTVVPRKEERRRPDLGQRPLLPELLLDESDETTECLEGGAIDLVVRHVEGEMLLERVEHRDHGHRVELRYRAEQRRLRCERRGPAAKAEDILEDGLYLFRGVDKFLQFAPRAP